MDDYLFFKVLSYLLLFIIVELIFILLSLLIYD